MTPLLRPGDRLLVDPARRPRRGDLVAVVRGGAVVVHRVVARAPGGCWTKGDAALALDPFVTDREVLGTVTVLETAPGRRLALGRTPWRAVQWLLGGCAWAAARLVPRLGAPALARLAWRGLRAPFYVAAWWARR